MMKDLFSLEGRTAIVTGGSRGIGKMIARGYVEMGAKVYITARKAEACDETAAELSKIGQCISIPENLSTVAGCQEFTKKFHAQEAAVDILVNNAGAAWGAPFAEFPEAGWDKVMDLNVKSLFFLTQALHEGLKKNASADNLSKVINIASIDGLDVNSMETYSYQASKAGVIHLTKRMALRLIADNIAVSAIAPGAFASEMNKLAKEQADMVASVIPAKRVGRDSDMAGTAVFLASRAGDYVLGDTLVVDGGMAYLKGH